MPCPAGEPAPLCDSAGLRRELRAGSSWCASLALSSQALRVSERKGETRHQVLIHETLPRMRRGCLSRRRRRRQVFSLRGSWAGEGHSHYWGGRGTGTQAEGSRSGDWKARTQEQ